MTGRISVRGSSECPKEDTANGQMLIFKTSEDQR